MVLRYGVDTSILVRLVVKDPPKEFQRCVSQLVAWIDERKCELVASNQVIGEAYATLTHRYALDKADARAGLLETLSSGLIAPLNGQPVLNALSASGKPGLFDRLIAEGYSSAGLETLTLDRDMTRLPRTRLL